MPLLPFKNRFEPFIVNGSKRHTIRKKRKIPFKVGDRLYCYVNPRQKTMRKIGEFTCVKVDDIRIVVKQFRKLDININGECLSEDEITELAWSDGFRDEGKEHAAEEMWLFWHETHGYDVFRGNIIHWKYEDK